jgi:hypothetical protein
MDNCAMHLCWPASFFDGFFLAVGRESFSFLGSVMMLIKDK